jgi:DNA-binding transcriptional MerR regulator
MFKIGEFSKLGQVSTRMLRHYDKLGLLVPEQIDQWTDYRYYSIQQLPRLHRIIAFKELGLSLQQIGELLDQDNDVSAEQLRGMLALKRSELAQEMREMEHRLGQVEARLAQLEQKEGPSPYEIVVKRVEALPVAALKQQVPHVNEMGYFCEALTTALYRKLKAAHIPWSGPELILYHAEEYRETDLDVEACVALPEPQEATEDVADEVQFRVLPAQKLVASLIYVGQFEETIPAVLALLRWVGVHQHVPVGPLRELHLSGPAHPDRPVPDLPVVELQIPITSLHDG